MAVEITRQEAEDACYAMGPLCQNEVIDILSMTYTTMFLRSWQTAKKLAENGGFDLHEQEVVADRAATYVAGRLMAGLVNWPK